MYIIFIMEIALLASTAWKSLNKAGIESADAVSKAMLSQASSVTYSEKEPVRVAKIFVFAAAIAILAIFSVITLGAAGQVFTLGDDVVSWNRWAVQWARGEFPTLVWHYPQLLPSNWSVSYALISDPSVQFFAKAVMPLFSLYMLLALLDLAFAKKEFGYVVAVIMTGGLLLFMTEESAIASGYADIPVAFMSFASIYALLRPAAAVKDGWKNVVIGAVIAAGAALTKQAGLFIVLAYPLALYFLFPRQGEPGGSYLKSVLTAVFIMAALTAPWYLWNEYRIYAGIERSELNTVTNIIHNGRTYGERFIYGLGLLAAKSAAEPDFFKGFSAGVQGFCWFSFFPALLAGILAGVFNKTGRHLLFLVAVPYFLIWGFLYSYDIRNATIVIPFAGAAAGFGIMSLSKALQTAFGKLAKMRAVFPAGLALLILLVLSFAIGPHALRASQIRLQREIGSKPINDFLYRYAGKYRLNGKILTNYNMLGYLPDLEEYYEQEQFKDLKTLQDKSGDPHTGYILVFTSDTFPAREISEYIAAKLSTREFELVSNIGDYSFIKVNKNPQ